MAGALDTREIEGEDQQVVVVDALRQARDYLARLEATKRDLAVQLELRLNQINASQASLDEELRVRVQLEAQLLQAQSKISTSYVESLATTYGSGGQVQNSPYQVTSLKGVEPPAWCGGRAFSPKPTYAPVSSVLVSGADRNYDGIPDVLQGGRAFSPKSTYVPVSSVVAAGGSPRTKSLGEELALPKFEIVEKLVEVAHVHEKDLVVEVPEVHHHKLTKRVPVYEEVFRDIPTEVRQIHHKEEVQVASQWVTEEVDRVVPRVTVREIKAPVLIPREQVENMIVEVPVALPGVQRVHERSIVDFKPFVHHVKGPTEIKRYETDVIEVPHVVEVPRHVPVPKEEYRIESKTGACFFTAQKT